MRGLKLGKRRIQAQGGTFRITLPKNVVETWKLESGDEVYLYYENNCVIVSNKKLD
ncbi:MAG: AbrB/MazE/SpoVT family DNA-binding domain-containing protein [Candidatus Thorarchaeota archaeon]